MKRYIVASKKDYQDLDKIAENLLDIAEYLKEIGYNYPDINVFTKKAASNALQALQIVQKM